MNNEFLNDSFIFMHPFRVTMQNTQEIIEKVSSPASLKDAKSGKYLLTNRFEPILSGLSPEEFIGLTVEDLNMQLLQGSNSASKLAFIKKVKEVDAKVKLTQSPILIREVVITHEGYIRVRNRIKIPVNYLHKTIALFNYEEDLTPRLNLFDLFSLYRQHYLSKQAVQSFLGYFKIKTYFQEMPTRTELLVIIAMSIDSRYKKVAILLKISPRTVAAHVFSVHQKLKLGTDFYMVLNKIRYVNQVTCSIKDWLTG